MTTEPSKPATTTGSTGTQTKPSQANKQNEAQTAKLGFSVVGLVTRVGQTNKGGYAIEVSTGPTAITIFSKENGLAQGDVYSGILRGIRASQYGELSGMEKERF